MNVRLTKFSLQEAENANPDTADNVDDLASITDTTTEGFKTVALGNPSEIDLPGTA